MTVHHLEVVPAPPPMPKFSPGTPVRPGERREPLPHLRPTPLFAEKAAEQGLAVRVAVELTLERALVANDLGRAGQAKRYGELLFAARKQRFTAPLPPPYRRYRDSLLQRRPRELAEEDLAEPVTVPLRFFPRVLRLEQAVALDPDVLGEAVDLELAALCTGRTMTEYALLFAATTS